MVVCIGLTGAFCAGKGAFIELVKKRFNAVSFSTSDEVRRATASRGLSLQRENLIAVANSERAANGPGYFAQRCVDAFNALGEKPAVVMVDGLRTLGEIAVLEKAFKNFFLVAVDAPQEVRYKRVLQRKRAGEHVASFEEWAALEEKELSLQSSDPNAQNIAQTVGKADFTIVNDGALAVFEDKAVSLVTRLLKKAS